VAYSASVSGRYVSTELFQRLGIAEADGRQEPADRRERVGAVVARGEAEVGFQQTSELLAVPGIDYVGPAAVGRAARQCVLGGVSAHARNARRGARAHSVPRVAEAAPVVAKTGLEPMAAHWYGAPGVPAWRRALYASYCAACHEQTAAASRRATRSPKMSPARILRTLDFGPMMSVAYPLKRPEREASPPFSARVPMNRRGRRAPCARRSTRILAGDDGTAGALESPRRTTLGFKPPSAPA
jgi:hypothetical protein